MGSEGGGGYGIGERPSVRGARTCRGTYVPLGAIGGERVEVADRLWAVDGGCPGRYDSVGWKDGPALAL